MNNSFRITAALALMAFAVVGVATPAQAHAANGGASCSGAVLEAGSYDGAQANRYTLTVDDDTVTGTFGESVRETVAVPQDGAVHTWSYTVEAFDGSYQFADSGQVGPCGTPPVVDTCPDLTGDQPEGTACIAPPEDVATSHTTALDCTSTEQVTTTTTTRTSYEFDQTSQAWVPGTPVETQVVTSVPAHPRDCSEPPVDHCPELDGVQTGAVACAGDSSQPPIEVFSVPAAFQGAATVLPATGAESVSSNQDTASRLIGGGALAAGLLLLGGLTVMRRRALAA